MSVDKTRETIQRLRVSAGALSVLGTAIDIQLGDAAVTDPRLEDKITEVVRLLCLENELKMANKDTLISILADIRGIFLQGEKLLYSSAIDSGWTHTEESILQSQAQSSALFVTSLKRSIVPRLNDLSTRIEAPSASFLDVGVGAGGISIAMARAWPSLRIVGIDPWEPALSLARKNISSAALTDRIELCQMRAEDLSVISRFDLVWFPTPFIPKDRIPDSLKHVKDAIRQGGWIISGAINRIDDPLAATLSDLHTIYWGGDPFLPSELETFLRDAGFTDVRSIPGPPWAAASIVVGCRL